MSVKLEALFTIKVSILLYTNSITHSRLWVSILSKWNIHSGINISDP